MAKVTRGAGTAGIKSGDVKKIKKGSKKKANEGIGIVPFVYDEAQDYYQKLSYKQEKVAETVIKQLEKEPVVIKVKKQMEKKEKPLYNLEEL